MKNWKRLCVGAAVLTAGGLWHLYGLALRAGDSWLVGRTPASLTRRIERLEQDVARLRWDAEAIPEARERLESLVEAARSVSRVVPKEGTREALLSVVRANAEKAGVTPRRLTSDETPVADAVAEKMGPFSLWRYSLLLEGAYDELATFVNLMEQTDQPAADGSGSGFPFFEIRDINISNTAQTAPDAEDGDNALRHVSTMLLQTYHPGKEGLRHD